MNAPVRTVYLTDPEPTTRFAELDVVRLREAVTDDDGRTLPAGACGTIVATWADGAAYEVEFTRPATLATVAAHQLERAGSA